jgi:hypothetical protein
LGSIYVFLSVKKNVWTSLVVCSNMKPKFLIDKVSYMMILERLSLLFHIVSFSVLHSNFSLSCLPVSRTYLTPKWSQMLSPLLEHWEAVITSSCQGAI